MKYVDKDMVMRVLQEEADLDGYEIDIVNAGSGYPGYYNLEIRLRTGGTTPVVFCELMRIRLRLLKERTGLAEPIIAIRPDETGPWLVLHFQHEYVRPEFYTNKEQYYEIQSITSIPEAGKPPDGDRRSGRQTTGFQQGHPGEDEDSLLQRMLCRPGGE
ncbi:MAG: hypothetical protein IJV37_05640 [Bacteroidales bacterium]|nr:hypothetical protein [Bacteroidales bacterium]